MKEKIKYLFVDFDGTVRETVPDPTEKNPEDRRPPFKEDEIKIIPGVSEKLKEWDNRGWFLVGVSNQSCVEKGLLSEEGVETIASATMDRLGVYFPFYYAPHKYKGELLYLRKPNIGMAQQAFEDWGEPDLDNSFMVGHYISDEGFAENLGIKFIHVSDFIKEEVCYE